MDISCFYHHPIFELFPSSIGLFEVPRIIFLLNEVPRGDVLVDSLFRGFRAMPARIQPKDSVVFHHHGRLMVEVNSVVVEFDRGITVRTFRCREFTPTADIMRLMVSILVNNGSVFNTVAERWLNHCRITN